MEQSILKSTKKILGIEAEYDAFDLDVITHINSVFVTLNDLGIGPNEGFMIEDDDALWADFLGSDPRLNSVKSYVYLRVRLLFDPPTSSYLITALNEQVKELEWRINVGREEKSWIDPTISEETYYPPPQDLVTSPSDTVNEIWRGTQEEYDALPSYSDATLYFITNS